MNNVYNATGDTLGTLYDGSFSPEKIIRKKYPQTLNLTLCALKTRIENSTKPYHEGFLFHKLQDDDGSLYYGEDLEHISKFGKVTEFKPTECLLAMSPSGIVVATKRSTRDAIYIYDGTTETKVSITSPAKPMGWLYNSGVEFIVDSNGVEYCIFAEYNGATQDKGGFYVWRGTYPYTSPSDWQAVFHQDYQYYGEIADDTITHFHQVRRDPWANILYLTSGDQPKQLKWWYSTDFGSNWTLLTDNATNGWEEHICRTINFIFTSDWIYWAVDHGTNHCLNKIRRNPATHIIDISTRAKVCDLPVGRATNGICYVESINGIFMYDRIDTGYSAYYGKSFPVQWWDISKSKLNKLCDIELTNNSWGGHRGKCYINYTSPTQIYPSMGFSIDTPCYFDVAVPKPLNVGSVFYEIIPD